MLHRLTEEDFAVLRRPLESGRQKPDALRGSLFIFIFLQGLFLYLEYFIGGYSTYPNKERIFTIHFWFTAAICGLSLIYLIPGVYKNSQKIQYFLSILASQNVGMVSTFMLVLFLISQDTGMGTESLLFFTYAILLAGGVLFVATMIRFLFLLHKGEYRVDSKKDQLRGKFETTSYLPLAIIGSTALVFTIIYFVRNVNTFELNIMIMVMIALMIFYTMIFVLPEQLVILYCKHRFARFNFNKNGYLIQNGDKGKGLKA